MRKGFYGSGPDIPPFILVSHEVKPDQHKLHFPSRAILPLYVFFR